MNAIDKIEKNAHKFKLTTNRINATMIKVYSSKFMFDSWIIEQQGFKLKLLHMSKKGIGTKCSYHLQRQVNIKNWKWVLETIVSHNKFVMTQKWNVRENLVDKKLRQYKEGKYERQQKRNQLCRGISGAS